MENILNIVNFIRGCEPRNPGLDLAEPVREQISLMKKWNLKGTFLLQYDAMLREDIVSLLLDLDPEQFELGIWFEMNQPHVEAAGMKWPGRPGFAWDWHANAGFPIAYPNEGRRKLVDVAFEKFDSLFHRRCESVGGWLIDAVSLAYMSDKYRISASCNCKDQWGTDGYTMWGGYWNQAYYPSRKNVFSTAQTEENQIPVPIFRMLGSDPVRQYDLGLTIEEGAKEVQSVASLEPVYTGEDGGGGIPDWVDWFVDQEYNGGSLAFAYAQAGQENSFGWPRMRDGLEYQFPLFARMEKEGKLRVERMADSGKWFKENFSRTPATSVCALKPYHEEKLQSIWYDCMDYRMNLYRDAYGVRIRDLTLFDENYPERYMDTVCTTEYLVYDNLTLVDGNRMSGRGIRAGAFVVDPDTGREVREDFRVTEKTDGLEVAFGRGVFSVTPGEISLLGGYALELRWNADKTAFKAISGNTLLYEHNGRNYSLVVAKGSVDAKRLMLLPEDGELRMTLKRQE